MTELLRLAGVGRDLELQQQDSGSSGLVDDVLSAIRADYEQRAYFVTGVLTDAVYDDDCYFADPTVSFSGRERWKQNLRLLVPFLEEPSILLKSIEQVDNVAAPTVIKTQWTLRTYLRLPWRPLICVDGSTVHMLNDTQTKVVSHVESWAVSGLEAISQIFVPSKRE